MALEKYQEKRNFKKTTEPKGKIKKPENKKLVFVVHEHWASHHHFDLRLEQEGVLKSWAVPKNIEEANERKILAVQVEDHPYDYKDFQGTIPEGQYGAGKVKIWDKGTFEMLEKTDKSYVTKINGRKLKGTYVLFKFKPPKNWLFFKKKE
jgi:DNA ligase D-like protein (predicted 3'-phosphoesterase)